MREYKQKRKIKNRIFSKLSVIILIIVFLLIAKATWSVYAKSTESASNLARVNHSIEEATKRQESLTKETERLKTSEGVEDDIRRKFQVSKEGEKVIIVVDDPANNVATTTESSLFTKIKHAILKII